MILVLFLVVVCLGRIFIQNTYAKFTSGYETGNDIANLNLSFDVKISNLEEYEEISVGANSYEVFNVNVKNSSSTTTYYGVWYMMASPKEKSSDIVIARSNDCLVNTSGSIESSKDVTTTIIVKNNSSSNIKVNIGVASSVKSVSDIEYLGGKKLISGTTDIPTRSLFDIVKKNAVIDNVKSTYVSSDSGIDFSNISSDTNGKGVYIRSGTENNTYPIYYYRGAVTTNNVLFAGICWKMVRTTETGGIKLIYVGKSTSNTCDIDSVSSDDDLDLYYNTAYASDGNLMGLNQVGYMYNDVGYEIEDITHCNNCYFSASVTYDNSTNTYTLKSPEQGSMGWGLHYTCNTSSKSCKNVYYIFQGNDDSSSFSSIVLKNGETIDEVVDSMLNTNGTSSFIKKGIDAWFEKNIDSHGYTKYLEDTVFCNDRSIYQKGGWDSKGSISSPLYFNGYYRSYVSHQPSLECSRDIDKFTVNSSKGNGDLTYPVGLLTSDEVVLSGGVASEDVSNDSYYLINSVSYLGTPLSLDTSLNGLPYIGNMFYLAGDLFGVESPISLDSQIYASPSISLKNDTLISGGNGSSDSPYLVSLS